MSTAIYVDIDTPNAYFSNYFSMKYSNPSSRHMDKNKCCKNFVFMLYVALICYTYVSFLNLIFMNKNKFRAQNGQTVSPRKKNQKSNVVNKHASPYIVLQCLADIYRLNKNLLSFAIAETADDDGGYIPTPVILIAHCDKYIDLQRGALLQNAYARNSKQNFFAAVVKFEDGDFVFSAPRIEAKVNKKTLISHYGTAIIG